MSVGCLSFPPDKARDFSRGKIQIVGGLSTCSFYHRLNCCDIQVADIPGGVCCCAFAGTTTLCNTWKAFLYRPEFQVWVGRQIL
jgi:hypothetical protein